ncbi:uncharacterized protein LOC128550765 [Mercenaria mercenaria]|uniref:uncharacterized protein LOC128550765 n=1 Tax=Mercenaria mercenaria TaxID=6596 RepID=UPI00234F6FC6|nr:uncharacterized protein LOC128550765 [Mercenaria mercenaria]
MSEKVPRRGRLYKCLHCEKAGKVYIEVKYRVTGHVWKHHFPLSDSPFYCTLCLFRSTTEEALRKHVKTYRRHVLMRKDMGTRVNDNRYLVFNTAPRDLVEGVDYRRETLRECLAGTSAVEDPLMLDHEDYSYEKTPEEDGLITLRITPEVLADFVSRPRLTETSVVPQQTFPFPSCSSSTVSNPVMTQPFIQQPHLPFIAPIPNTEVEANTTTNTILANVNETVTSNQFSPFNFLEALCSTPTKTAMTTTMSTLQTPILQPQAEENILDQILPNQEMSFGNLDLPLSIPIMKSPEAEPQTMKDEETQTEEPQRKRRRTQDQEGESRKLEEA